MKTIYAIPGLGTTEKLFSFLKLNGCELKVLSWPKPLPQQSMKEYAQMFVEQINTNEKFYLLGVSLGGMLCSELSHLVNAEKTILISSCKTKNELPILIRALNYIPLQKILPEVLLRKMALHSQWLLGFKKEFEADFKEMINSMPENYFLNTINMIVNWDNTKAPKHCIHIHGTSDRLLLFNNVKADHVIQNGNHAMIVYKADEISEILNRFLD